MRLSYSTIDTFNQCKRWFYLTKIKELSVPAETTYADRGTIVHECLEHYYKNKTDSNTLFEIFKNKWETMKLNESKLQSSFIHSWVMVTEGIKLNLHITHLETELITFNPDFVGYLDAINTKSHIIYDWKTATYRTKHQYESQMRYYAYLYYKTYNNIIPTTKVIFLKSKIKINEFKFTIDKINQTEKEIIEINTYIEKHKHNEKQFPRCSINPKTCPYFCPYKKECFCNIDEFVIDPSKQQIKIVIQNNSCFLEGHSTVNMLNGLEKALSYDKKQKYFMQKNAVKRGIVKHDSEEYKKIGTVFLFDKFNKKFNLGHLAEVQRLLKLYADYKKLALDIVIEDRRNKEVLYSKLNIMPRKLNYEYLMTVK